MSDVHNQVILPGYYDSLTIGDMTPGQVEYVYSSALIKDDERRLHIDKYHVIPDNERLSYISEKVGVMAVFGVVTGNQLPDCYIVDLRHTERGAVHGRWSFEIENESHRIVPVQAAAILDLEGQTVRLGDPRAFAALEELMHITDKLVASLKAEDSKDGAEVVQPATVADEK